MSESSGDQAAADLQMELDRTYAECDELLGACRAFLAAWDANPANVEQMDAALERTRMAVAKAERTGTVPYVLQSSHGPVTFRGPATSAVGRDSK